MADRTQNFGMDLEISRRIDERYDFAKESEVVNWIQQITGRRLASGKDNLQRDLMNGQILCSLISRIYDRTDNLPGYAKFIRRPIKYSQSDSPFQNMENIELFLSLAETYGVPRTSLFQVVDLYEGRNMAQVLSTLLMLGTECQRNNFMGPVCGPKPTYQNKRYFSEDTMRSGEGIIGLQSGTNKFASQAGMRMGGQRHIADIRCDDISQEGQAVISLQMGSNKFANQKGMKMGAIRHIADIKIEEPSLEGQSIISLQMGTNKFASQKGMRMGATRHVADLKVDKPCQEGESIINLQYGTNKGASQSGMRMGGQRHAADMPGDNPRNMSSHIYSTPFSSSKPNYSSQQVPQSASLSSHAYTPTAFQGVNKKRTFNTHSTNNNRPTRQDSAQNISSVLQPHVQRQNQNFMNQLSAADSYRPSSDYLDDDMF